MVVKFSKFKVEEIDDARFLALQVACSSNNVGLSKALFGQPSFWWEIHYNSTFAGICGIRHIELDECAEVWLCVWNGKGHIFLQAFYDHLHYVMEELGLRFVYCKVPSQQIEWILLNHGWQSTGRLATYVRREVNGTQVHHRRTERRPVGWSHYLRSLPRNLLQMVAGSKHANPSPADASDDGIDGVKR